MLRRRGATVVSRKSTFLLALLLGIGVTTLLAKDNNTRRYAGHKIVRVDLKNQAELDALEQTGANILNCIPGVGPMDVLVSPAQRAELERRQLPFEVLHDDVNALLQDQRFAEPGAQAGGDPFDDFFLDYHDYDGFGGIVWYMNELVARYPSLASMVNVGTTLEGRTIWGLRIAVNAGGTRPGVVYFGCEHAREWITTTVPTYFATYLLENYGGNGDVTDAVDNVEFFLIPVFNVDGYVYTATDRMWRKNRRNNGNGTFGVDLNRNWAEGWGGEGSSGNTSSQIYRGPSAFSEPETQVLRDFFLAHTNVVAQLDIHNYSQLILWPYGYTPTLPPDQNVYADVGFGMQSLIQSVHGRFYDAGPIYTAIYPASGVSLDWTYAQLDILSYSFECRDTGQFGFLLPPSQIIPNNEELVPAIMHLTNSEWVRGSVECVVGSDCNDVNECTNDQCVDSVCVNTNNTNPCHVSDPCYSGSVCSGGECILGDPADCDDGNACTDDTCTMFLGCLNINTSDPCDDGDNCTTGDTCSQGECVGSPVDCDDANPCTDDVCAAGTCRHTANREPCDGGDVCQPAACSDGECLPLTPPDCDDGNPCTDDECDPSSGCMQINVDIACDDGDPCTSDDMCTSGVCAGILVDDCDDGNACTTNDSCSDGACQGSPIDCDDQNSCTDDSCDSVSGCIHLANADPCDDGDACTTNDTCSDGSCGGATLVCGDGNPCTDASCHPLTGCQFVPNNLPCDDGVICTSNDTCSNGSCGGTPFEWGDVNHDSVIDLSDVLCVLDGFAGIFERCAFDDLDMAGCAADGLINLSDILAVLDAFHGVNNCCTSDE